MVVKIIKSSANGGALRMADAKDPAAPHVFITKGETRDDMTDNMCAQLIELGYAEEAAVIGEDKDAGAGETKTPEQIIDKLIIDGGKDEKAIKSDLAEYAKDNFGLDIDTSKTVKKIRASILKAAKD